MSESIKLEPYEHTTSVSVCMGEYWDTVYLGGHGTARRIYDTLTRWESAIAAAAAKEGAEKERERCRKECREIADSCAPRSQRRIGALMCLDAIEDRSLPQPAAKEGE